MKIAIPTITSTSHITGVAEYLINLIDYLQKIDITNDYYIITCPENRYMFKLTKNNFHEVIIKMPYNPRFVMMPFYHIWQNTFFIKWCKKTEIDLVHLPNTSFINKKVTTIITIHDLAEYYYPRYSKIRNWVRKKMVLTAVKNARAIIAVSNSTKDDILKIGNNNTVKIYNGFECKRQNIDNDLSLFEKYGINKNKYFVCVGSLIKHKNINGLITAFNEFYKKNKDIKLLIIGNKGNAYQEIINNVQNLNLKNAVSLLGYIDDSEKEILIKNSISVCFVSFYEGFGFPILEAQCYGVPILLSNTSCLPEISGESAFFVDPHNPNEIALKLQEIYDLIDTSTIIEKGYKNLQRFSWEETAKQTLHTYTKYGK